MADLSRPHYNKNGHWMPTFPGQICAFCEASYTAHKKGQAFCSKSCSAKSRGGKVPKTYRTCPTCSKVWQGWPSNKSVYCSKACMFAGMGWKAISETKCQQCGKTFRGRKHGRKHCSKKCADEAKKSRVFLNCAECGKSFERHSCRADEVTCSVECRTAHFIRDRSHGWTGGKILQNDRLSRRIDRDGFVGKYDGEHRLIAAREIGRPLHRLEVVICLDRNNNNLDPANLYLLPNMREWGLLRSGAYEWPSASNLEHMRKRPYIRPDVVLTLHEWENGQRRENPRGKPITRHPQADEIIKRRKAGATITELAIEFGCGESSMQETLKKRL